MNGYTEKSGNLLDVYKRQVQQGAADTGEIAGNCAGATDTPPGRMPKISTGTGVDVYKRQN